MRYITAFIAGLVFSAGLLISQMTQPRKVVDFLDLAGAWDPSLGLVMLGAIAAGTVAFRLARKRPRSLLGLDMHWPTARHIDKRLVTGGLLFGIGWGIAGLCPGPTLTDLATGNPQVVLFVIAMLAGMAAFQLVNPLLACCARPERTRASSRVG